MKILLKSLLVIACMASLLWMPSCNNEMRIATADVKEPVDYVNPYMGNISHLLVPTFPTVHLPYGLMRMYPERSDYTGDRLHGLPLFLTSHRGRSAFFLSPWNQGEEGVAPVISYSYDLEKITSYRYSVYLDEADIEVDFAPSSQSAIYSFTFNGNGVPSIVFNSRIGELTAEGKTVWGHQQLDDQTKVYLYAEVDTIPLRTAVLEKEGESVLLQDKQSVQGYNPSLVLQFPEGTQSVAVRYGISFISEEQAKNNLERDIYGFNIEMVADIGRTQWNNALGKIQVEGGTEDEKTIFYTSLYRCFERPVKLSEDGRYYSAAANKIIEDEDRPYYTDDWLWDTYRATHPLRVLIDEEVENDILHSYIVMAEQMGTNWLPTFPQVTGDQRGMNSNHGVASIMDAYIKGLRGFDLEKAYLACKAAIEEKTLIPWSGAPAGELDEFYKQKGYFPALKPGEKETVPNVHEWEKRQPIAVTLGTAYDQWCLSLMARELGRTEEADHYLRCSYNYRNVFHPETKFFHPKDKDGNFIEGLDYRISGGPGAREYYDENNGYIYRWDVQHNIGDLINLIGGDDAFIKALDDMFNEPLGMSKWQFYAVMPDHTGNVGQFSMANEPSLHIPYLYNYAGQPWKTQKRIRTLLNQWFRNDLMGVPGDEDGGGMSAFVVFSQLGFYPVTPGSPTYNIGSPVFANATVRLSNGNTFEIKANNASPDNKYIQSAKLNGKDWDKSWFGHSDIINGGVLEVEMSPKANKSWGVGNPPPSAEPMP